jgi:hypothetical protein
MPRSLTRTIAVALATAAVAAVASAPAGATTVSTEGVKIKGGTAGFGSGHHSFGNPEQSGTITWDYTASGGNLFVKARVLGTLYWDSLDPGCAEIIVSFQDRSLHDLVAPTVRHKCGGGGDANLAGNQTPIDISSPANPLLDKVVIQTRQLNANGTLTGGGTVDSFEPLVSNNVAGFNDGTADFGGFGQHSFGSPSDNGKVELDKGFNQIEAHVYGRLYWDALFASGCAKLLADYQDVNGVTLKTEPTQVCGPGGDANNPRNQTTVDLSWSNPALFKVRLRIGSLTADGSLVNVKSQTFSFA